MIAGGRAEPYAVCAQKGGCRPGGGRATSVALWQLETRPQLAAFAPRCTPINAGSMLQLHLAPHRSFAQAVNAFGGQHGAPPTRIASWKP